MFLHRLESSLCQPESLMTGTYLGVRRLYLDESTNTKIIYIEWHLEKDFLVSAAESDIVRAAEIWILTDDGAIRGMDFKRREDGSWIDGDGLQANNLDDLMPLAELGHAIQISEDRVGPEDVNPLLVGLEENYGQE